MREKLEKIKVRYEELTNLLSDPSVISNQEKYRELSKEHSDLSTVVRAYADLLGTEKSLKDTRELADSADEADLRQMAKQEAIDLEAKVAQKEESLKNLLIPRDPSDSKDVILEIRSGTGGEEAALFAADLYRMYSRLADNRGWKVEALDFNETGIGGFKEVVLGISGKDVYADLKYESGVHRVQSRAEEYTLRPRVWWSFRRPKKWRSKSTRTTSGSTSTGRVDTAGKTSTKLKPRSG